MIQRIDQIAEERRELYIPKPGEQIPYIGLEHIEEGTLRLSSIGNSEAVSSQKKKFYKGDVLYGSLRPYFRKVVKARFDGVSSTDITVLKPKNDTDTNFLFYLIASNNFIDKATMSSNGTKMPRAGWKIIKNFSFEIPDNLMQVRIGTFLGTHDDLIGNNER
jgi:type I restriction enzyme S subunit